MLLFTAFRGNNRGSKQTWLGQENFLIFQAGC